MILIYLQKSVKSRAWGYQVWRGEDKGEVCITRCYKHDWKLVPKSEEESFTQYDKPLKPPNIIPDKMDFAPLHEMWILQQRRLNGDDNAEKPQLQRVIKKEPNNRALLESEAKTLETGDLLAKSFER